MSVLPLKHPFEFGGHRYEALTLGRPKGKALRCLDKSGLMSLIVSMQDKLVPVMDEATGRQKIDDRGEPEFTIKEMPQGIIDKFIPYLAIVAKVDEAVIDEMDGEDLMDAIGMASKNVNLGPLGG